MSARIQVSTGVGRGLEIERITPKLSRLICPNGNQVIFWEGKPMAAFDGAYLYVIEGSHKAKLAALTIHWSGVPVLLQDITTFEFTLGQTLSKAGLMLVRRLDP